MSQAPLVCTLHQKKQKKQHHLCNFQLFVFSFTMTVSKLVSEEKGNHFVLSFTITKRYFRYFFVRLQNFYKSGLWKCVFNVMCQSLTFWVWIELTHCISTALTVFRCWRLNKKWLIENGALTLFKSDFFYFCFSFLFIYNAHKLYRHLKQARLVITYNL